MRGAFLLTLLLAGPVAAETTASIQARRPDLVHPETGLRIARQHAPTPDDIPGAATAIDADTAAALIDAGALPLDVFGAAQSRYDELDGTWLVSEPRMSLPGATWLPEVGRGTLTPDMSAYLAQNLARLAPDLTRPIVVFCVADCWMSWNAAQRIAASGHSNVYWLRLGTDGWAESGRPLATVAPVPVGVE